MKKPETSAQEVAEPEGFRSATLAGTQAVLRTYLHNQTRLVDVSIAAILLKDAGPHTKPRRVSDATEVVPLMLQGVGVSSHSIIRLCNEVGLGIRDCFGIARTITETAINIGFIIIEGEKVAQQAKRHADQKYLRDLKRTDTIAGIQISSARKGADALLNTPEAAALLDEFSSKKGREKNWTDTTIRDRIVAIEKRYPAAAISFSTAYFSLYRRSSEIMHGSYYGTRYFLTGHKQHVGTRHDMEELFVNSHLIEVMTGSFVPIDALLRIIVSEYDLPGLGELRKRLFDEFSEYILACASDGECGATEVPK